jgi:hypothetical protein
MPEDDQTKTLVAPSANDAPATVVPQCREPFLYVTPSISAANPYRNSILSENVKEYELQSKRKWRKRACCMGICGLIIIAAVLAGVLTKVFADQKAAYDLAHLPPDPSLDWPKNGTTVPLSVKSLLSTNLKDPTWNVQRYIASAIKYDDSESAMKITV